MGINDREFQKIVPNFVEMERAYEGTIRFLAQEVELMEGMKDSFDTYNRVSPYQLAASNAELLRRKLFSDIGDLRQIYWSKLNKKNIEKPLTHNELYNSNDKKNLNLPLTIENQNVDSIALELPRQGGFPAEPTYHTGDWFIDYRDLNPDKTSCKKQAYRAGEIKRPKYTEHGTKTKPDIDPRTVDTKHIAVDPAWRLKTFDDPHGNNVFDDLASTPANLYFEAGVLLERILPIVKVIVTMYQNQPPLLRYEKHIATAGQLIHNGILKSSAFTRFVGIRNILKEKFFPTMG